MAKRRAKAAQGSATPPQPGRPGPDAGDGVTPHVDGVRSGVALLDDAGRVTVWSHALARLTGVSVAEAQGRDLAFLYPDGGAEDGAAAEHLALAAALGRHVSEGTRWLADGPGRVRAALVALGPPGALRGFALTLVRGPLRREERVPPTSIKELLDASAQANQRARTLRVRRLGDVMGSETLRAAFDLATDSLIVTDEHGMLLGMNRAATHLLGVHARDVPRRPIFSFVPISERVGMRRLLLRLRAQATVVGERLHIGPIDGEATEVEATATLGLAAEPVGAIVYWTMRPVQTAGGAENGFRPQRLVAALEEERLRLSREIHDVLGQSLAALSLEVKALEAIARGPTARGRVARVRALIASTSEQAHEIARTLRLTSLVDLGLVRALSSHLNDWGVRAGLLTDFLATGMEHRLPADVETTLYRVAQEALTNIARHARASRVSVVLERTRWQVLLVVDDDGRGFAAETPVRGRGLGLLGARERLELVGGSLSVESEPRRGTSVFARVPLNGAGHRGRGPDAPGLLPPAAGAAKGPDAAEEPSDQDVSEASSDLNDA